MNLYYYDIPRADSFGGVKGLRRQSKKSRDAALTYLSGQDAYTLHKEVKRKFRRRKTFAEGINDLWQADLVDLSKLASSNDGFRHLLMTIDVFSKYARIVPLKTKKGKEVRDALASLISEAKPTFLQTDKGTEFLNFTVQNFLKENDIKHYTSENDDIKCAVVERFNRTILSKLSRYFTYKSTTRYLDVIQDLLRSYNDTEHSSIKMAPSRVTANEEPFIR